MKKAFSVLSLVLCLALLVTVSASACGYGNKVIVCQGIVRVVSEGSHYDYATQSICYTQDNGSYCSQMCSECYRIYIRNINLHRHSLVHSWCGLGTEYAYCPVYF